MIEVQSVSHRYGAHLAVENVSFQVAEGELLALVGTSGSGKTTTLKMINRLIEPSAGRVLVEGADTATLAAPLLRRRIGYVFQGIGLFPHLSVGANIALPLRLAGWDEARRAARVRELLELVELEANVAERDPRALSGGQQQRVGVARALANAPRLMLLDEPFGALDPPTRARLQSSFLDLHRRLRLSTVLVTHDMAEALLADRIGVMRAGRLVQLARPEELLRAPADEHVAQLVETPLRQARRVVDLLNARP
jgi:osmoprotectant transport system ATP-binding protein